jgi:hypothetical protein
LKKNLNEAHLPGDDLRKARAMYDIDKPYQIQADELTSLQRETLKRYKEPITYTITEEAEEVAKIRNKMNRLKSGADVVSMEKEGAKIRPAPRPEALRYIDEIKRKPIEFSVIDDSLRSQYNRLRSGSDIVEISKDGTKIRKAPKPEVLKSFDKIDNTKTFEFNIDDSVFKNQYNRLKSGADKVVVEGDNVKVVERAGTPQILEKPIEVVDVVEIKDVIKNADDIRIKALERFREGKAKPEVLQKFDKIKQVSKGDDIIQFQKQAQKQMFRDDLKTITIQVDKQGVKTNYAIPYQAVKELQMQLENQQQSNKLKQNTKQILVFAEGIMSAQDQAQPQLFKQPQEQLSVQDTLQKQLTLQDTLQKQKKIFNPSSKVKFKEGSGLKPKRDNITQGYQPIRRYPNKKEVKGKIVGTMLGAENEGMLEVDNDESSSFRIKKVKVRRSKIKRPRESRNQYKFYSSQGTYYERDKYTNDKPKEKKGKFNWMKYMSKDN